MPIEGVDYAAGPADYKALKAAGKKFVCRYLAPLDHQNSWKVLRGGEARMLKGSGLHIVTVWESWPDRALDGRPAGITDAKAAMSQLADLGAPKDAPVYFAVDFDASEAQQAAINRYLNGAAHILGKDRVGVYGGFYVVKRALEAGVCKYGWQTYAWSGGQWHPGAHLQQYQNDVKLAGVDCDLDRAMDADFGQWHRPKLKPRKPWPTPLPKWVWAWVKYRKFRKSL